MPFNTQLREQLIARGYPPPVEVHHPKADWFCNTGYQPWTHQPITVTLFAEVRKREDKKVHLVRLTSPINHKRKAKKFSVVPECFKVIQKRTHGPKALMFRDLEQALAIIRIH